MSRRNNDAITIHSICRGSRDNLESPLSLEKVSERPVTLWHLQRMFKKETGHSSASTSQPQADGDCAEAQAEQ